MKYLLILSFIGFALAGPAPVVQDVTVGTCPASYVYPNIEFCTSDCVVDSHCEVGKKCCLTTNCGMKCISVDEVTPVRVKTCPVEHVFPIEGVCNPDCEVDAHCEVDQKCCMTTNCGLRCISPEVTVPPTDTDEKTKKEITELLTTILEERKDLTEKLEKYPPAKLRYIAMKNRTDVVRMCVTNWCEKKKCYRMAQELTYNVSPRKEFYCQLGKSVEQCMFWAERGWTDLVMARDMDIYTAKTKFNLTALLQEFVKGENLPLIEKITQNFTLAVTKVTSGISNLSQLQGSKVCSAGINNTASFINPVATLIREGIIPATGNVLESASDFFGDMCVPGALNKTTVDINGTLPEKLTTGCNGREVEFTGIQGSLRCAASGNGIAFVDHKVVQEMITVPEYNAGLRLVCEGGTMPLTSWFEKSCQVGRTPRPIMFMNPMRNETYKAELTTILTDLLKLNTNKPGSLDVFDSTEYKCGKNGEMQVKDLIFLDESNSYFFINETIPEQSVVNQTYFKTYNTCKTLVPKPTAKFCVSTPVEYNHCLDMKHVFESNVNLRHIAWGCVLAKTKMDCMRNVLNGTADLYSGNVDEVFIGGHDLNLQPIMMQDPVLRDTVDDYLMKIFGTHSVAVMKKSKLWKNFGQDTKVVNIRNLTLCSAGIDKIESFHLPIGRLLSMNVIPRIGSVFESVNRFFKKACIPGASPVTYRHDLDLILGHEHNWGIPGLNFYNFTGFDWFIWNSPHTWNFYNYNRKTPGTLQKFMKNRLLVPILEGKLSLPDEFDVNKFDYSILEDVLSVEGLGDILSDIPDQIRDRLVDLKVTKEKRKSTFKDLYEEKTGDEFVRPKDKRLGRQTIRSYMQKSFDTMQDEWGIFESVDRPKMGPRRPTKTLTGSQITNIRRFIDGRVDEDTDPNSIIGNLLQSYDSEYTVPLISKIFAKVLRQRFDTLDGLAESMNVLRGVPVMADIHNEQYEWIKHPAVQAFVRIYAPRLVTYQSDLFSNTELDSIVHSRYLNPLWLSPTYPEFLDTMKKHMTDLTDVCQGFDEHKGCLGEQEPFYGLSGSIQCIADGNQGDIALVELEKFVDELPKIGQSVSDYVIITPLGIVKEVTPDMLTNITFLRNVTFGVKAYPAIMTAFNKTGSWRWNITKALLTAQKIFSTTQNTPTTYTMFGPETIFAPNTKKLVPIPIQDQTFPTYLGPNLTRSFEALIKPSTFDWWKERRHICSGETYTNVIEQHNGTCKAIVKDVTCMGMPRPKVISVGTTENKQPVVVRMCSRPTRFVREMAEFVCNNGHGYLTPVMTPTTCECVPCEEIEYQPEWTKDPVWNTTHVKHTVTEHFETLMPLWGNEEFWMNHTLNTNFMIGHVNKTITDTEVTTDTSIRTKLNVKSLDTCEANWYGYRWHSEWFPETNRPVCLGTVTGLRRVLTSKRVMTKVMP